ncbi:MAG: hypothetical protein A2017_12185 [Lentisphaerae bacterium GWF2_44_16]|nr:MAG: hypothetical protein A2017_12185 [Lentisphaerae bacterium GWF2_44_16]
MNINRKTPKMKIISVKSLKMSPGFLFSLFLKFFYVFKINQSKFTLRLGFCPYLIIIIAHLNYLRNL